ncbi:unnamed protein product [Schistosoma spindalis]|nr:unnamed protein product [Schistosoma spindale]
MNETDKSLRNHQKKSNCLHYHKPFHAKIAKTSALCYTWISLGLYSEILGPTLPTLMYNTKSNYEQIGMALSTRAIGLLIGSFIGGILSDRYKSLRILFIILSLIIGAITTLIIPWCINIILLTIILFIAGFSHGLLTTSGNPLLASVWEEKAAGPFSLMHSGYGMGAALAPLLVKPFTIPSTLNNTNTTTTTTTTDNNHHALATNITTNQDNSTELVIVNAVIPYSIVAGIVLFCVFYFLLIMCIDHSTNSEYNGIISLRSNNNTKITSSMKKWFNKKYLLNLLKRIQSIVSHKYHTIKKIHIVIISCTFITFFTIVGNERVFGKFMFTYSLYGPIQLNIIDSYFINLIYWLCFCIARIITFFIAIWLKANLLLFILCIGTLCSSIGLIILPYEKFWFYLCTILFGLFKSPLFPITLATINQSLEINGFLIIIVNFGSSFGATLLQFIAGYLIHQYGQFIFPYLVMFTSLLLLITSIILILSLLYIGNRFKQFNHIMIDTLNENNQYDNTTTTTNNNNTNTTTTTNNNNNNDNNTSPITILPRSKWIPSKFNQEKIDPIHVNEKL